MVQELALYSLYELLHSEESLGMQLALRMTTTMLIVAAPSAYTPESVILRPIWSSREDHNL